MGKEDLTLQALPPLIKDTEFPHEEIIGLVKAAVNATEFARDWRNRTLAHTDLKLAIQLGAEPLTTASRKSVADAINAVSRVIQRLSEYHFKSDLLFDVITPADDAVSLLYVIRDGLKAEEERRARLKEGKLCQPKILADKPGLTRQLIRIRLRLTIHRQGVRSFQPVIVKFYRVPATNR